jgi:hypothetical protein
MALSKIDAVNFLTGTIPQGNVANASLGAVTALPAGVGGKVLQVVTGTTSSSTATSAGSFVATSLTANITPSATSSKIVALVCGGEADTGANGRNMHSTIFRGSTNLGNSTAGMVTAYGASSRVQGNSSVGIVDSPSSTSQLTYTCYIKSGGGSVTLNANPCLTSIILMEVSG